MRRVTAADGREWKVGRRWLPWKPRLRDRDGPDLSDAFGVDDPVSLVILAAVVLFTLTIIIFLPVVILVVEVTLLLVLGGVGLFARVVLGRPWTVRAVTRSAPTVEHEWRVKGWRASRERVQQVADELRSGTLQPSKSP